MLYGKPGLMLEVPASTKILEGHDVPALTDPKDAVIEALARPIDSSPLPELLAAKGSRNVAITISDITRPVPNKQFLPAILKVLNSAGVADSQIVIIIGTGMHRLSTDDEQDMLVGKEILQRIEVINHRAGDPQTLVQISGNPAIKVCRRFAEADFRIVTGYIEPHFMAGFSGGRKGVCPALVDLETLQCFHGYDTLANPAADTGNIKNNPCHEIALNVAQAVGVDFLFNVAVTRDRQIADIYCGDLEKAHQVGCEQVAEWTTVCVDEPFGLVITNGGGFPLDQTFYQTVKGMCTALPALGEHSTLLQVSDCSEQLGSKAYTELILHYDNDWRRFLKDIEVNRYETHLDQWQYQMQARVLARLGLEELWFVSDGIPAETRKHISVMPILGPDNAQQRAQRAIDEYIVTNPGARIAAIPEGPYTIVRQRGGGASGTGQRR